MEGLEHRVRETMEQYHMLEPGDRVIAAVSGGADSVCLLALLCAWREPRGISIRALHVHHGLRGEEADRDADFVRSLCEGLHVPCHILKVDVRGLAAEKGMSEEEAGRFLRYEALEKEALDWEGEDRASGARSGQDGDWAHGGSADRGPADGDSADGGLAGSSLSPVKIAVAHHSGDQVETILHNLFRLEQRADSGIIFNSRKILFHCRTVSEGAACPVVGQHFPFVKRTLHTVDMVILCVHFIKAEFKSHVGKNQQCRCHTNRQSEYINETEPFPFHQIPPSTIPVISYHTVSFLADIFFPSGRLTFSATICPSNN